MTAPARDVCDRCGMLVVPTPAGWAHAEPADAVFCLLVMQGARP